jgi:hypothetical protein
VFRVVEQRARRQRHHRRRHAIPARNRTASTDERQASSVGNQAANSAALDGKMPTRRQPLALEIPSPRHARTVDRHRDTTSCAASIPLTPVENVSLLSSDLY